MQTTDAYGRPISLGSVHLLRAQLDDLYERVRSSMPQIIEPEIDAEALDRHEFLAVAAYGLRTWRDLATVADERRLPMVLDS